MVELFLVVILVALFARLIEHRGAKRQSRLANAYWRASQSSVRGMRRA